MCIRDRIQALLQALSGQQFVYQGRNVQVTPTPRAARGIAIAYGGHSKAAARRAGRFGLDFYANGGSPELVDIYTQAALSAGKAVGNAIVPAPDSAQCVFVAQNLDRAWNEIGPYMLHDIKMYRQWEGEDSTAVTSYATNIDEIREESGPYRIVTPDQALEMITTTGPVSYTHLRAHETVLDLVCRLLLEKKKKNHINIPTLYTIALKQYTLHHS